ncbi:hypothetical protein FLCU109888_09090 [Flavobacterium cucumis]|uniref:Uncharacterized protein n=1 Tax=Flavobacterium cucumis TaxID=416016 RepID=A0A1M7ZX21_9FLAO|nr:hypothetical protein [Flavobacterium cucumis]SHO73434.1 hypothetical protein SAMN05443547_1795 [Flavobacterium cucumis]
MRLLFFSIFCFLVLSCKVDESDLRDSTWKIYKKNSYEFGDVISFDAMIVKNDTIYLNRESIYEIIAYRNRYFTDEFITIKNLKTQNSATYIKK